jgi:hypothetical protein
MAARRSPLGRILATALVAAAAWTACGDGGGARDVDAATGDTAPDADAVLPDVPPADAPGDADAAPGDENPADAPDEADTGPEPCPPAPPGPGEVRARAIACAAELPAGYHVAGRVGDFVLENAVARFVVRGVGEGHALLGLWGGGLVDAVGPGGDDQLRELQPLISFNVLQADRVEVAADGRDGEAVVAVHGVPVGHPILQAVVPGIDLDVDVVHEYVLRPDEPWLKLRTRFRPPSGTVEVVPGDLQMLGGRALPFVPGTSGPLDVAIAGPFLAAAGGGASYAYVAGAALNGLEVGGSEILLADPVTASAGAEGVFERTLVAGDGTLSSVTGAAWTLRGDATGPVAGVVRVGADPVAGGYEVRASDPAGRRLTVFRTGDDGTFAGRLPTGPATLVATCDGCADGTPVAVEVAADGVAGIVAQAAPPSFLEVTVRDAEDGAPVPGRVAIESLDAPGARPRLAFTGPATATLPLAPGTYRVTLSRGPEFARAVHDPVAIAEDATVALNAILHRVVQTPGAIAAEFHLHCESSVDSAVPVADRVAACAAEGLEFVVATDHDFVTDYGPALAALGLGPFMTAVSGCEVSSIHAGHFQSWPRAIDPDRAGNGAPRWFHLSPPALADLLRAGAPGSIVQVNHPRFDAGSTFELIDFDPADGRAHADPVSLGFPAETDLSAMPYDAIEVFNGIGDEQLDAQLADWYALLNLGHRITATAGGDSHDLASFPGNPRNLVLLGTDDPADATPEAVMAALRAMRNVVTSGPALSAGILRPGDGAPSLPGDVVTDTDGQIALHVTVQAPDWIDVDEVVVVKNGVAGTPIPIPAPAEGETPPVMRFQDTLALSVDADAWFVVIARGDTRDRVMANVLPVAVTNPFYVDADGDGAFTPPGL